MNYGCYGGHEPVDSASLFGFNSEVAQIRRYRPVGYILRTGATGWATGGDGPGLVRVAERVKTILSCRGVAEHLDGRTVIEDVWFDIRQGEAFGVTGTDGVALSTLVRIVCGVRAAANGTVLLNGRRVDGLDQGGVREAVGYLGRGALTLPALSVRDNVRLWAGLYGLAGSVVADRVEEVLTRADLEQCANDLVGTSQAGVVRRANLAIALLCRPRLLVMDEPCAGMSAGCRQRLLAVIGRLREGGTGLLYASRNAAEVRQLCDQVGVLDSGHLCIRGQHIEQPLNPVAQAA